MWEKGGTSMTCTEAYKEHIEYTFNAFCRVVIHYAAINAWRDRDRRRQREISFEYLTEEKFYPFCTSDTYYIDPYKQYPVMMCSQRVILTNRNLAAALSSLPDTVLFQRKTPVPRLYEHCFPSLTLPLFQLPLCPTEYLPELIFLNGL